MAIPVDRNVTQKEEEEKLKYMIIYTEIQQMWNMKCMIISAINAATGMGNKRFKETSDNQRTTVTVQLA